jgi:hypothetical protein
MQIEQLCNPAGAAFYGGGFAVVFKHTHQGLEVAVKVVRVRSGDLRKMTRVSNF